MSEPEKHTEHQPAPAAFDGEMAEILESFLVESNEIIDQLGRDLLTLEKNPSDPSLLNTIFRAIHTLKGTSSFLGFGQMAEFTHRFEDLLNKLRKGERHVTVGMMDVILEAYDTTKALLGHIEAKDDKLVEIAGVLAKLDAQIQGTQQEAATVPVAEAHPVAASESGEDASSAQTRLSDTTIRVDVNRLDDLMNLVGELVLGRNRLSQVTQRMSDQHEELPISKELYDTNAQIDFITTELQMAVMKTRMLPVAKVFNRLPRLVRDLCKETGKEVDLQVYGKETELDKSIIEELNDPLVHIIRNAVDHGIEPPDERLRARKPKMGTIVVNAEHEGNHIVLSVEDDGRGIDPEALKLKAVERGFVTEAEAREMSRRDAFNLIFLAGFSTAASVTAISGRGVGMDVVQTNISKLKGIVDIESQPGKGTIITLRLPMTLAIVQTLLVQADQEIYAVPLGSVLEVVRVNAEDISTANGRPVIRLRDTVLPLARMSDVMGVAANGNQHRWHYVVVVAWAEQRLGIIVDSLMGQREVVIKSLGEYLNNIPGIAGSTILGDGRTILIIDAGKFVNMCLARSAGRVLSTHIH